MKWDTTLMLQKLDSSGLDHQLQYGLGLVLMGLTGDSCPCGVCMLLITFFGVLVNALLVY